MVVKNIYDWEDFKKYILGLSKEGIESVQKRIDDEIQNEERKLRSRGTFERKEKELDFINEVISSRK
jgi:predicted ester cyclase